MTVRRRVALAWTPAVLWALLIFVLSAQPVLPAPPGLTDKAAHAITYGVLALFCLLGLTAARLSGVRPALLGAAFLLAVAYGVSDEFHQAFVPGRSPELADLVADATGAAVALMAAWLSAILLGRRVPVSHG